MAKKTPWYWFGMSKENAWALATIIVGATIVLLYKFGIVK